jgi:hypothetical protein
MLLLEDAGVTLTLSIGMNTREDSLSVARRISYTIFGYIF